MMGNEWKWMRATFASLLLVGVLTGCGDNGGDSDQTGISQSERQEIEAAADSLVSELDVPGVLISVQKKGGDIFEYATGVADTESGRALSVDDHIRVGSISKSYAAMTALVMVSEGIFSLDDTLADWIPGTLDAEKYDESAITLRSLLNHTSGIESFTHDEQYLEDVIADMKKQYTVEELISIANDYGPAAEIGEFYYSNTNSILVTLMIEKATGKTYREVLQEKVLTPLGLTQTSLPETGDYTLPEPYSKGYVNTYEMYGLGEDEVMEATEQEPSAAYASGAVVSTIGDLARWMRAIADCELLDETTCNEQHTYVSVSEGAVYVGLGIIKEEYSIPGYVGHRGQIFGYDCSMQYEEEEETVVVGCTNKSLPQTTNIVVNTVGNELFDTENRTVTDIKVPWKRSSGLLNEY